MSELNAKATITLNINGAQAKQMMDDLENKIKSTKKEIADLKAAGADPKLIEKARNNLKSYQKQLDEIQSAAVGVGKALENLDTATPRQLEKSLKTLNRQLKDMVPGTEVWNSHIEKIKELKQRLAEIRDEQKEQESIWQRFKGWATDAWPALDLITSWGSSVIEVARNAVDAYASMDQEMANVRKFTGMTEEQVASMNEEFKNIDTRTPREDLNKLAQEAGRLGKTSQEDVMGFVRAADQINVALDDIGEGATLKLSKLTGIFGDEKLYGTEQSLLKVGSVINELSQNSAASAAYLTNFASRMGGVGAQAKMTIPQIMAFGAVLDANGQAVEASSTALSQVIVRMMQEPAKYAKVAGLDVQKFTDMLKTDVNGALLMFLETLQKAGGMDVLSPMFKDMGENGSRAIAALSTLATHIDEVKKQQIEANTAFRDGTSVTKEFNVQNNTVEAGLEKARIALNDIRVELGERIAPLMSNVISSSSVILRILSNLVKFLFDNKSAILSVAAGIAAYTIAVNLATIKTAVFTAGTAVMNAALAAERIVILAASVAWNLMTGHITRATAAFKLFSAALKANPIGLVVGIIATAITALSSWISKNNEAKRAEKEAAEERRRNMEDFRKQISDTSKASADYAKSELDRLKKLYAATQDQTKSQKERIAAVAELQKTYPTAFGNLTQEQILAGKASKAYNELAGNIILAAKAKAAAEKIQENEKMILELDLEREDLLESIEHDSKALELAKAMQRDATNKARSEGSLSVGGASVETGGMMKATNQIVDEYNTKLDESGEKLENIILKTDELRKANERLAKKAGDPSKIAPDITFARAPEIPSGSGYVSEVQSDKEKRKAEREAARAAAKEKKEFKERRDEIKAERDKAQAEALALRSMGEIDYLKYTERKLDADKKYYDDSIALFEKWGLQEDDECQALVRKREEFLAKSNEKRLALNQKAIERAAQIEERMLNAAYNSKSSHSLAEQLKHQEDLLTLHYNKLADLQSMYDTGSEEWENYQRQIDDLFYNDQESKRKMFMQQVAKYQKEFDELSVKQKYDMEREALKVLYENKKITEEQYRKWLAGLDEKEAEDTEEEKNKLPGMKEPDNPKNRSKQAKKAYEKSKDDLKKALNSGLINEEEYETALQRIENDLRKSLISPLQDCKSEWVSLMFTMTESWAEFANALKDPDGDPLNALANAITATAGVVTAVMSSITEFQRAEYEIQAAEVKKRYDAEIDAAEGNSYRTRKLEKEREKELEKLKKEQSQKQFALQVIATIAQTAANAVQAYSAGLSIGGPAGLIMAPIAAAMAVAQGAIQIALIKKQQQAAAAQGYSKGGFTPAGPRDKEVGVVHAGEWVASQKLLANPRARSMINALDYVQRTNTVGSLNADDVSRSIRANDSIARAAESDNASALIAAALVRNAESAETLTRRLREPLGAIVTVSDEYGINKKQEEYAQYLRNKSPKSRRP